MKIKQLLVATSLLVLFTLAGCEAQKPLTEDAVASVAVEAPAAEAVVATEPAVEAAKPDFKHCKKHHGKNTKACAKHCDHKALAAHSCPKHMEKHHGKKSKACVKHCSKEATAVTK
jgi:heterodisulfide reductase subunit A-like polyferredoxin